MTDYVKINLQSWDERATIHARDTTGDYMLDRFRAGEDALHGLPTTALSRSSSALGLSVYVPGAPHESIPRSPASWLVRSRTPRHSIRRYPRFTQPHNVRGLEQGANLWYSKGCYGPQTGDT